MERYCCQIRTQTGRILEIFYDDFFEAVNRCMDAAYKKSAKEASVFKGLDFENPICVARI